jgi:PAS domain S-box-containing protein
MTRKNTWPESAISPLPEMITPPQIDVSRRGAMQAGQTLRKQAEKIFRDKAIRTPENLETLSIDEIHHIFHELQVHQIELEMQNEELHRIQDELEFAMARYFDLYDLAPIGYCTISETGLILEANLAAARLLGVARGELSKESIFQFILKEDQDIYYLLRKKLFEVGGEPQTGELRMVRRDGTTFWAHLETTMVLADGGDSVGRLMLSDITNRKRAEGALQESNRQNQEILDSITDAFISLTDDMVVSYFNSAAERMLNHKRIDVIGRKLFDVFPEARGSIFEENYSLALRTKAAVSFETEFKVAPYQNWYDVRVYPIREGITIYFQVITARKRAEEEKIRVESVKRQIQKVESLDRMAGAIAHHFNNKLHVVMGRLELAMKYLPRENESYNDLVTAMQAADQAAEVSRLMLTYLGQTNGAREPLDLSEICRSSLPLIQASMPKNVVLETDLHFPGPTIKANANQIQMILTNLMSNSWEAIGDRPGTIHLSVTMVSSVDVPPVHRFPISWQPEDESCAYSCLEVRDTGCGLPEKDIEEVFDPFFSTKFTGRGLGLPVVLGLIQAHSGVVTIESTLGQGSVFRAFFPRVAKIVQVQPGKAAYAPEILGVGTILLVDDDKIVLELTSTALSMMGFKVLTAMDGIEAVEVFQRHKDEILLVLSDFSMPRMNGWDTLIALRRITPEVRVILASGYSEEQVMEGTHPELPQVFLGKPYGFNDLKDAIGRALTENKK